jgi:MerR family transcriptional regulator, copper efflux regulator
MDALHVGHAAKHTGWSARMLRYLERAGLIVPSRTPSGYRLYGLRELNQLRALAELRERFGLGIGDIAFAARLRREPQLRAAVDGWLADLDDASPRIARGDPVLRPGDGGLAAVASSRWVEWEQRKHERLLTAA